MESPTETTVIKPDRTVWYIGGGCLLLLCCGVALTFLLWFQFGTQVMDLVKNQPTETMEPIATEPIATLIPTESPAKTDVNALGDPDAPVTIIVYSDFQCPYCERYWRETEPQIIANYVETGDVYYVYRSLGAFIGPESQQAAEAAYCAGDQGKFWEYHDLLFENQAGENQGAFSDKNLLGFAESLELDMDQFSGCFGSGKYTDQVEQDRTDGQNSGVQGTPSFLINGTLVEGAQPYEYIASVIDKEMGK